MLPTIDFHENLVDEEGVTITTVLSLQPSSILCTKFDAPEPDSLAADGNASLGQKIFNIPVAEIESMVEPNGIANDVRWKSVTFVCVHVLILSI